jgi:hypothetical protein
MEDDQHDFFLSVFPIVFVFLIASSFLCVLCELGGEISY